MRFNRFSTGCSNRIALFLLILFPLYSPVPAASTQPDPAVAILRLHSYAVPAETVSALDGFLQEAADKSRIFKTPQRGASLWYEYETGKSISPGNLSRYEDLCGQIPCRHLLMGMVYPRKGGLILQAKLYSASGKRFLWTLDQVIAGGDLEKAASLMIRKVTLYFDGKLPTVSALMISRGTSKDSVTLTWSCNTSGNTFTVSRSSFPNGPYETIGETGSAKFSDSSGEPGIKYWYRINVTKGEISGIPASGYGFREPPDPKGITLGDLLDGHNKPWPVPATEEERERDKKNLQLYEKYYESYIMMNLIIMVGRIYINSGELLAFRGFKFHSFDQPNRIVYFSKPGMPPVKFYSRRFFRFFRDVQLMDLDFEDILTRMIDNAVMFCIRSGYKELHEPDGRIRCARTFEVVGMITEYHRDYEKWKSNAVVFGTSDENLYRRIREAQMKGY